MNVLAIDTSTSNASIALAMDDLIVAEALVNTDRTLSARLLPEIDRIMTTARLDFSAIDLFSSSIGPGSFTGVRGGVATIQGLALATGKPCVGFSSLAMLAMNFSLSALLVCPMLDARKSEVYGALYDCSSVMPEPLIIDCVLSPTKFLAQVAATTGHPVIFVGDGARRYQDQITAILGNRALFAPCSQQIPHAANGALLAIHTFRQEGRTDPSQLLPLYLRASDAELLKKI